jgi:uncharacterized protein YkwD
MLRTHGRFFAFRVALLLAVAQFWSASAFAQAADEYLTPVPIPIPAVSLSIDPADESQMIADVNASRSTAGLPPLEPDPLLASVARAYAHDMAARRYFGHYNPEGQSVGDRLEGAGIAYQYAGENIAFVQNESEAMEGFLNSAGHKANILSSKYTRIGIGVIVTDGYGAVYVQEFSDGSTGE